MGDRKSKRHNNSIGNLTKKLHFPFSGLNHQDTKRQSHYHNSELSLTRDMSAPDTFTQSVPMSKDASLSNNLQLNTDQLKPRKRMTIVYKSAVGPVSSFISVKKHTSDKSDVFQQMNIRKTSSTQNAYDLDLTNLHKLINLNDILKSSHDNNHNSNKKGTESYHNKVGYKQIGLNQHQQLHNDGFHYGDDNNQHQYKTDIVPSFVPPAVEHGERNQNGGSRYGVQINQDQYTAKVASVAPKQQNIYREGNNNYDGISNDVANNQNQYSASVVSQQPLVHGEGARNYGSFQSSKNTESRQYIAKVKSISPQMSHGNYGAFNGALDMNRNDYISKDISPSSLKKTTYHDNYNANPYRDDSNSYYQLSNSNGYDHRKQTQNKHIRPTVYSQRQALLHFGKHGTVHTRDKIQHPSEAKSLRANGINETQTANMIVYPSVAHRSSSDGYNGNEQMLWSNIVTPVSHQYNGYQKVAGYNTKDSTVKDKQLSSPYGNFQYYNGGYEVKGNSQLHPLDTQSKYESFDGQTGNGYAENADSNNIVTQDTVTHKSDGYISQTSRANAGDNVNSSYLGNILKLSGIPPLAPGLMKLLNGLISDPLH